MTSAAPICHTKTRYASPQAAWTALTQLHQRRRKTAGSRPTKRPRGKVYQCPECHTWHITRDELDQRERDR